MQKRHQIQQSVLIAHRCIILTKWQNKLHQVNVIIELNIKVQQMITESAHIPPWHIVDTTEKQIEAKTGSNKTAICCRLKLLSKQAKFKHNTSKTAI